MSGFTLTIVNPNNLWSITAGQVRFALFIAGCLEYLPETCKIKRILTDLEVNGNDEYLTSKQDYDDIINYLNTFGDAAKEIANSDYDRIMAYNEGREYHYTARTQRIVERNSRIYMDYQTQYAEQLSRLKDERRQTFSRGWTTTRRSRITRRSM